MYSVIENKKSSNILLNLILFLGVIGIVFFTITGNPVISIGILMCPFAFLLLKLSIYKPIYLGLIIFIINYFIMGIGRYIQLPSVSVLMDILLLSLLFLIFIHGAISHNIEWRDLNNILVYGVLAWSLFCIMLIINPTSVLYGWVASKNLVFNPLLVSVITLLIFNKKEYLNYFIITFSILTLIVIIKVLIQKFIGFDQAEYRWLASGGAKTHIIHSGTRYFSFFTDASNMGSNMGFTSFFFLAVAVAKKNWTSIYYGGISIFSLYALFLSGTRGAIIVPIAGLAAYVVLSKKIRSFLLGVVTILLLYIFFAHTYVGESNGYIRRMRTAFKPSKDASFNVRKRNQARLAEYLEAKPFGEGLGLSGVENLKISDRLTTQIPNDSWLVKIWVESGVVGLSVYLGILFLIFLRCSYIIMFKISSKELKYIFIGMIGGVFGLLVSSYGNSFFGQYPTHYLVYISFAIVMNYKYFDNKII